MAGQLTISDAATRHLDFWADQLQRGEIAIWQLPPALQQFISIGWAEAHLAAVQQAADYEHRLDLAHLAAYSPKDRRDEYQRRLTEHFLLEDAAFFAAADEETENANTPRRSTQQGAQHYRPVHRANLAA